MLPEVIPLASIVIDWNKFLSTAKQILGRSISQDIDNNNISFTSGDAFLIALGGLLNTHGAIPGNLLQHQFFSFLIIIDDNTYIDIIERCSKLSYLSNHAQIRGVRLAVVSGTLESWHNSIINFCSGEVSFEFRLFLDRILLHFERMGFERIFSKYKKTNMPDNTFKLELK